MNARTPKPGEVVIPKEHDVVRLSVDYAGVPAGAEGSVVQVFAPDEEEVGAYTVDAKSAQT